MIRRLRIGSFGCKAEAGPVISYLLSMCAGRLGFKGGGVSASGLTVGLVGISCSFLASLS